jgi:hypothetical protein
MLVSLGVRSIRLMTNNPNKIAQLEEHGICVSARVPHVTPPNEHNRFYLATKAARCGHRLNADPAEDDAQLSSRITDEGEEEALARVV